MSATITYETALAHAFSLMNSGHTMTEILSMIAIKGKALTEQIDTLTAQRDELRKVYAHINGIRTAPTTDYAASLITNRKPAAEQNIAIEIAEAQFAKLQDQRAEDAFYSREKREQISATPTAITVEEAQTFVSADKQFRAVPNGTYTVVMGSERRTIKLTDHWDDAEKFRGTRVAKFLNGPCNEGDYVGFAFVSSTGKAIIWKKFRNGSALLQSALAYLLQGDNHAEAGYAYALESGNCWKCNRKLTVPASISRGVGPECARKLGL